MVITPNLYSQSVLYQKKPKRADRERTNYPNAILNDKPKLAVLGKSKRGNFQFVRRNVFKLKKTFANF